MNATRLNANPLSQDLQTTRPVLSGGPRESGGLLSGLLRSLLPSRSGDARSTLQRAEPRLQSTRVERTGGDDRREPYLFGQRGPSAGTAD
jgi:hypothetical protein